MSALSDWLDEQRAEAETESEKKKKKRDQESGFLTEVGSNLFGAVTGIPQLALRALQGPRGLQEVVEGVGSGISEGVKDTIEDPTRALPFLGEMGGALLLKSPSGALGGRVLGESLRSLIKGESTFTPEAVSNIILSPLSEATINVPRGVLARKGLVKGEDLSVAPSTIVERPVLSPQADALATNLLKEAREKADAKRALAYSKATDLADYQPSVTSDVGKAIEKKIPFRQADDLPLPLRPPESADIPPTPSVIEELVTPKIKSRAIVFGEGAGTRTKVRSSVREQEIPTLVDYLDEIAETKPGKISTGEIPAYRGLELEQYLKPANTVKSVPEGAAVFSGGAGAPVNEFAEALTDPKVIAKKEKGKEALHQLDAEKGRTDVALQKFEEVGALQKVAEDQDALAKATVLDPLFTSDHPFVQQMSKMGLAPWYWGSQRMLRKHGGTQGRYIADLAVDSRELMDTANSYFHTKATEIFDTFKVGKDDHQLLDMIQRTPRLMELVREADDFDVGNILKQVSQETGKRFALTAKDLPEMTRLLKFTKTWQSEVTDPLRAFAYRQNNDPKWLKRFNENYILPTFTSSRKADDLADDIAQLERQFRGLDEAQQLGPYGQRLAEQIGNLQRKHTVALDHKLQNETAQRKAAELYERQGVIPKQLHHAAFKNKYTDLGLNMDLRESAQEYISGFIRKAVYDQTLPKMLEVTKGVTDERLNRYMTNFIFDQTGGRRISGLLRTSAWLNDAVTNLSSRFPAVAKNINSLKKQIAPEGVQKIVDVISGYNAVVNIGLNPRFYPLQMGQLLVTLRPLVGDEAFSHGLSKGLFDFSKAYDEAVEAGAVQAGLHHLWEDVNQTGTGAKTVRFLSKGAEASETFNRVVSYHSGLYRAEKAGLRGRAARKKAVDVSRMAQFGYTAVDRPQISGTQSGSLIFRYKSFGAHYGNYLAYLATHNPLAAIDSLVTALAFAGTSGIPFIGAAQGLLAKAGVVLPNLDPFTETTGIDLGGSADPLLKAPEISLEGLAGPIIGPVTEAVGGMVAGDPVQIVSGVKGFAGAGVVRPIQALAEYAREGETRTPSGRLLVKRSGKDIAKFALGLAPSARGVIAQTRKELEPPVSARDYRSVASVLAHARKRGLVDGRSLLSQVRAANTRSERRTALDELLGR